MDRSSSTITGGTGSLSQQYSLLSLRDYSIRRPDHDHLNQVEDSEISIFDAQKYFNDCTDEANKRVSSTVNNHVINLQQISQSRLSSAASSDVDGYGIKNYRARSFNATPTASSEASWNSKTGLLSNPPGAIAVSIRNPSTSTNAKKVSVAKWFFGRKCPCSGKKSVQVEENLSESKIPAHLYNKKQTQNSIEISCEKSNHRISPCGQNGYSSRLGQRVSAGAGFSFSILDQTSPIKQRLIPPLDDPPRESLEIFQPPDSRKSIDHDDHQRMVPRQSFTFPASPKSRMMMITDDDVASDASSDLFEIESFSTQTTSYTMYHHRRDLPDEASSFNSGRRAANGGLLYCKSSMDEVTEFYEPSEASIDWSVTTAEGFDRGSVANFLVTASEMDDTTTMRHDDHHYHQKKNNNDNAASRSSSSKKLGNGLLLSCRCERAVSVGPNPVKCLPAETSSSSSIKHVNCRPLSSSSSQPPLARSHSARLSLPFAT